MQITSLASDFVDLGPRVHRYFHWQAEAMMCITNVHVPPEYQLPLMHCAAPGVQGVHGPNCDQALARAYEHLQLTGACKFAGLGQVLRVSRRTSESGALC